MIESLTRTSHRSWGYALYITAAALFALNGTVAKTLLLDGIDSARLSQMRVTAAFLIMLILVAVTKPHTLKIRKEQVLPLLAYGILGVAMTQYLYFVALRYLPVGVALLIEFTAPLMVALWFRFAWKEPTKRLVWLALTIALIGLAMVGQVWQGFTLNITGVLAAFGAAVALAIYFILGDKQVRGEYPRDAVSLTMWGFGAAALFWFVAQPWWSFPWGSFTGVADYPGDFTTGLPIVGLTAWMVVMGTIVPFWLVVASFKYLRASQASTIGLIEPLLAIVVAWIALGESMYPVQIAGGVLILAGVYLAERSR